MSVRLRLVFEAEHENTKKAPYMIKAIVFDYNGVLVNDLRLHEEVYWRASRELGFHLTRETIRRYISYPPEKKRTLYFGDISDETWQRLFDLKERYYFELAKTMDLVFPDVEMVLVSLSRRYTLVIISNTYREYFDRVFPRHLAKLFKESVFADEVERPKPSPDVLVKVIERIGITADECCYVGDSVLDVQMARTVGVRMFAVATGDNSQEELREAGADLVMESLKDLAMLLEASA